MHLADELLQHLFGDCEVGDDAILHRANHRDGTRRLAEHFLGALADGLDGLAGVGTALHANGNDRRLVENDAFAANIDQRIGGTQVDREVVGKITAQKTEHASLSVKAPQRLRIAKHL